MAQSTIHEIIFKKLAAVIKSSEAVKKLSLKQRSLSPSPIHHGPHLQESCDFENTAKAHPMASNISSVLPSMLV